MKFKALLAAALVLLAFPAVALAQASTANQVTPGVLTTTGCPSVATTPCFLPYSATNPLVTSPTVQGAPVSGTGGVTAVTAGTTSAQAVAAATRTSILAVKNESATASIAACLGACTAALNTAGDFTIGPGQMLTLSSAIYVPGDAVNIIASAASTPVTVFSK